MKAVRDLDGVGGALLGASRQGAGSIPADHADVGMSRSPQGHGLALTIGPEGERSMPREINPDGPRGPTVPHGPVGRCRAPRGAWKASESAVS